MQKESANKGKSSQEKSQTSTKFSLHDKAAPKEPARRYKRGTFFSGPDVGGCQNPPSERYSSLLTSHFLSHSANCAIRDRTFLQIQQDYGNRFVQGVVKKANISVRNRPSEIQAKLRMGQPGDKYELEADRMAEQVMRMPDSVCPGFIEDGLIHRQVEGEETKKEEEFIQPKPISEQITPLIQKQVEDPEKKKREVEIFQSKKKCSGGVNATADVEPGIANLQGIGKPLSDAARSFYEPRFGYDFGGVRIHTGDDTTGAARSINAKAFTIGSDIVFDKGNFSPETEEGKKLLAHELTHVVQQNGRQSALPSGNESDFMQKQEEPEPVLEAEETKDVAHIPTASENVAEDENGIEQAIANKDVSAIKSFSLETFKTASMDQRYKMIQIVLGQRWVGPYDEEAVERIWKSFGKDIPEAADANIPLWEESIQHGAELDDFSVVEAAKSAFEKDVKKAAYDFLTKNRNYVWTEMGKLGIPGTSAGVDFESPEYFEEIKAAATEVARAQLAERELRGTQVGYTYECHDVPRTAGGFKCKKVPAFFNPKFRPSLGPRRDESPPLPAWDEVKKHYDRVTAIISAFSSRYPVIYALVREGKAEKLADAQNSEEAKAVIGKVLNNLLDNIEATMPKIYNDDLDYRDLKPIHDQLFRGKEMGSGISWNEPFYKWAAKDLLEDYEAKEFWISLGLGTLAAAAFVVAELVTFGTATYFIAVGVGIGAGALQAGMSWEKLNDLATAADTNLSDEMSLIYSSQVKGGLISAILDTAFLFLDVYGIATRGFARAGKKAAERKLLEEAEKQLAETQKEAMEKAAKEGIEEGLSVAEKEALEKQAKELGIDPKTLKRFKDDYIEYVRRGAPKMAEPDYLKFRAQMLKGKDKEKIILKAIGKEKNNKKFATTEGDVIPDIRDEYVIGDIKDVTELYLGPQMRGLVELAEREAKRLYIYVRGAAHPKGVTHISKPLQEAIDRTSGAVIKIIE